MNFMTRRERGEEYMTEIKLKLQVPSVPNFIRIEMPAVRREDGFLELPTVDIGELSVPQLDSIAAEWKEELFKKAKQRSKAAR